MLDDNVTIVGQPNCSRVEAVNEEATGSYGGDDAKVKDTHTFSLQIYLHLLAGSQVKCIDWNRGGVMISEMATVGSR